MFSHGSLFLCYKRQQRETNENKGKQRKTTERKKYTRKTKENKETHKKTEGAPRPAPARPAARTAPKGPVFLIINIIITF